MHNSLMLNNIHIIYAKSMLFFFTLWLWSPVYGCNCHYAPN